MTKMFNNVEELNEFLSGGRLISNISFVAGMISVVVSDSEAQNSKKEAAAESLTAIINDISTAFSIDINARSLGCRSAVPFTKMKAIIDYAKSLPENTAIAVVEYFVAECSGMSAYEARKELKR